MAWRGAWCIIYCGGAANFVGVSYCVSYCIILWCIILYHTVYHTLVYHTVVYHTVVYHTVVDGKKRMVTVTVMVMVPSARE